MSEWIWLLGTIFLWPIAAITWLYQVATFFNPAVNPLF